ncbi:MAG TPA: hypothetical protein VIB98_05530, partial [Gemmatimonadaceae bacterium]
EHDPGSDTTSGWFIVLKANPLHMQPCGGGSNVRITWQERNSVRVQEEGHAPPQLIVPRLTRKTH